MINKVDSKKIVVAIDKPNRSDALSLVKTLDPSLCRIKVGKELFTASGPEFVKELVALGFDVFLDLKFHDIPSTVAKAVAAAAELGVWMVNVHASGGKHMMEAALKALEAYEKPPLLIAVTVLTSMSEEELKQLGVSSSLDEHVLKLATLAKVSGLDGVVCSAREAAFLKSKLGKEFILVTPGVRPAGSEQGDQKRILTPRNAIQNGSDYLVIGRPITQSENPQKSLKMINDELLLA